MDAAGCKFCIHGVLHLSFFFFAIPSQVIYLYGREINKLRPLAAGWSVGQMGQHSPKGISGLGQSFMSSQIISSHRTVPVSQTQIRQGSGFHTSLSLYLCPSCTQLPASSVPEGKGKSGVGAKPEEEERKRDRVITSALVNNHEHNGGQTSSLQECSFHLPQSRSTFE